MLSLPASTRIFVCRDATDMRKSFDGLFQMTRDVIRQNPLSGHLFVFFNRRRNRVKILYWDRDGLAIWAKRLEQGCFRIPKAQENTLELDQTQLTLILGGIDLETTRRRKRYTLPLELSSAV